LHQTIAEKGVTKVATPWPASDPAMTPRGEEAAARAKQEEKIVQNHWKRVAWQESA
jgi:hypothetical protein